MPLKTLVRNALCSILIFTLIAAFPSLAIAQEAAPEDSSSSASTSDSDQQTAAPAQEEKPTESDQPKRGASNTGPTKPTGADSKTYTKNDDGTWTNGTYTWDPNTKQTKPNTPQEYSYNPATGMWDTTEWVYHPESGKYVPNVKSTATNPSGASGAQASALAADNGISNTGPNSTNSINLGSNTNGTFDLFFNGAISNTISSSASTGDALVQGNTSAGSALTGDAQAIANVLNLLQSSWLGQSGDLATFISNIDGNVYGDLTIDPSQLPYTLSTRNSDVDVNISNNGVIDNDIDLTASTGDATVDSNTLGGDATSGNARAMANIINMINSSIAAGKSFLGMININGNLDGDILLPAGVLDALIASTGPNSSNTISNNGSNNLDVNNTANRTINNDVSTDASTGNATVSSNTTAGNATSGQASTGINTMNLVGQDITGRNGLLVFVNVLGHWVGMIITPEGARIANTGPNSTNSITGGTNTSVSVNATENSLINNDIDVAAHSGDATVSNNTQAGNARTGNADASVNLLNMIGSNVNMEDWFGVLFINVFGNWFGSFGGDTSNGGCSQTCPTTPSGSPAPTQNIQSASSNGNSNPVGQVFGFVTRQFNGSASDQPTSDQVNNQSSTVLAATTTPPSQDNGSGASGDISTQTTQVNWWIIAGVIGMIATIIVLVREYVLAVREERLVT